MLGMLWLMNNSFILDNPELLLSNSSHFQSMRYLENQSKRTSLSFCTFGALHFFQLIGQKMWERIMMLIDHINDTFRIFLQQVLYSIDWIDFRESQELGTQLKRLAQTAG